MSNTEQHQELIDALKFMPRDIDITLLGYGGEIVMGRITPDQYTFWKGREDFTDYIWDWDYQLPEGTDPDMGFVTTGSWHECDDIAHECSMEMSSACVIRVTEVESGEDIWENSADIGSLQDAGVEVEWFMNEERADFPGQHLFIGQSIEKGCFGSYRIRITRPFDPTKLRININEVDGWCLCGSIEYDGEEPENQGDYDTTGKGSEFVLHYEPESGVDYSDWHDADATHPAHEGLYDIEQEQEYTTERRAWWLNGAWRDKTGTVLTAVQRWRGLDKPSA